MGKPRKQRQRRPAPRPVLTDEDRERATAQREAAEALRKMTPEERAELEQLRAQALAQQQAQVQAATERFAILTLEWALCAAYEPIDLEGRVRCIERALCPLCGACLPRMVEPIPPLYRLPGEGDPYDRATPHCPNRVSEIRARGEQRTIDDKVKLLTAGTAFSS